MYDCFSLWWIWCKFCGGVCESIQFKSSKFNGILRWLAITDGSGSYDLSDDISDIKQSFDGWTSKNRKDKENKNEKCRYKIW